MDFEGRRSPRRTARSARAAGAAGALAAVVLLVGCSSSPVLTGDAVHDLQARAVAEGRSEAAHWGPRPDRYVSYHGHTNRLIPVYTFGTRGAGPGIDLDGYVGENSVYRDAARLERLYGRLPEATLDPEADWLDQTELATIQRRALESGRRRIVLVIFDGMDWPMTRAAAIVRSGRVGYDAGRGTGLFFQDYEADGTSQFAAMVTSPHDDRIAERVDEQRVHGLGIGLWGGYDPSRGGRTPWAAAPRPGYPFADDHDASVRHAVTDSAAAATAFCSGVKTYNYGVNVDPEGRQVDTVAHDAQRRGFRIGVVTSVPISHATPAAAYAQNVSRLDYQDLTRDLLGLPSIAHPDRPLPGVDVLIGAGAGVTRRSDSKQGQNFVPGNRYLTDADRRAIDVDHGGRYVVAERRAGEAGREVLASAAERARESGARLLGLFGVPDDGGHLPYRTADGDGDPAPGRKGDAERYTPSDLEENPRLVDAVDAALTVLEPREGERGGFWLMVEAGDVDWASHDANLDNAIGAVIDGDEAVRHVAEWIEGHGGWSEAVLIVTADHGHYLVLSRPERLLGGRS